MKTHSHANLAYLAKISESGGIPTYNGSALALAADVTGLLDFKGSTDASSNPNYPAAAKGDSYLISVAGKIGGASGKTVAAGDMVIATADNAGGTEASVGTSWTVIEGNQIAASQAEAEAGTEVAVRAWSPLRVAQAIAALGGGGGTVSDPNVAHVRSDGNDTTGDGSPGAPYLTAQKAVDEGFSVLDLGVGSFGNIDADSVSSFYLLGRGAENSAVGTISKTNDTLNVYAHNIEISAIDTAGHVIMVEGHCVVSGNVDSAGATPGANAGAITLRHGVRVLGNVTATGNEGSAGDEFTPGGNGGNGAAITLQHGAIVDGNVDAGRGAGGSDGGAGAGSDGSDGSVTALWSTLPTPSAGITPTIVASVVNGVFQAS